VPAGRSRGDLLHPTANFRPLARARRQRVYRWVLNGLAAAFALTRFMAGLLYEIKPADPLTFIAVPLFLALVVVVATCFPAMRAMHVDPMVALRHE
jgi:ABC-type lipoprotein release transport system permease subunit